MSIVDFVSYRRMVMTLVASYVYLSGKNIFRSVLLMKPEKGSWCVGKLVSRSYIGESWCSEFCCVVFFVRLIIFKNITPHQLTLSNEQHGPNKQRHLRHGRPGKSNRSIDMIITAMNLALFSYILIIYVMQYGLILPLLLTTTGLPGTSRS